MDKLLVEQSYITEELDVGKGSKKKGSSRSYATLP